MAYLANYIQQAFAAASAKVNQVLEAKATVDKHTTNFINPFGESNDSATLDNVDSAATQFAQNTSAFVIASQASSEELVQASTNLSASIHNLLLNVKGVAKKTPAVGKQLTENAKAAAIATQKLLEAAAIASKQGNVTTPQNVERDINLSSRESYQQTSNIISLVKAEKEKKLQEVF